jgi:Tripartite tricarboxylate transporter family receptor
MGYPYTTPASVNRDGVVGNDLLPFFVFVDEQLVEAYDVSAVLAGHGDNAAGPDRTGRPGRGGELSGSSVRIVVPFPAGGSNDVVARFLAMKLSEAWSQQVVIDNRAGAGGNIGAEMVAQSTPDGYTLLLTAPPPLVVNQSLYPQLAFDPVADFAPVALVASVQIVLAVNPEVKATDVRGLIALAKAAPGQLNFGSSGYGSTNHLAGELFKKLAGIDIVHVPYRGAAPAMNDLSRGIFRFCSTTCPRCARRRWPAQSVRSRWRASRARRCCLTCRP